MICIYCQGRKRYRIGPKPQDERDCRHCGGVGETLPIGTVTGFKPTPPPTTLNVESLEWARNGIADAKLAAMKIALDDAEAKAEFHRRNLIDNLRAAELSGVRVIPDHRMKGEEMTILVSPQLFRQMKEQ